VAAARAEDIAILIEPDLSAAADPDAFDRIVSNLIANALTYGEQPITVSAAVQDRHFRLTVEDRGRGVPAEFAPRLFDRFTRADRSGAPGAGLGLSLAQAYARAHGGLLLYADADPHGASFQLVVPVVSPTTDASDSGWAPACIPLRARCVFRGWNTGRAGRGGLDPLEWTNASRPAGSRRGAGRVA